MSPAASPHETHRRLRHDPDAPPRGAAALVEAMAGPARVLTLEEWAAALGGLRFVELSLFELLGAASVAAGTPAAVASWAAAASGQAAWRAEQLEGLLPVSVGLPPPSAVTVAPGEAVASSLSDLARTRADGLAAEMSGRWYPALSQAYGRRAGTLSPAADRPHAVVLARVLADLAEAAEHAADLVRRSAPAREGA